MTIENADKKRAHATLIFFDGRIVTIPMLSGIFSDEDSILCFESVITTPVFKTLRIEPRLCSYIVIKVDETVIKTLENIDLLDIKKQIIIKEREERILVRLKTRS